MKDLFVELADLAAWLGLVNQNAIKLRTEMLHGVARQETTEGILTDQLHTLATRATSLAAAIRDKRCGISFADDELPEEETAKGAEGAKAEEPEGNAA